jgi:chromosome segregation ATPase
VSVQEKDRTISALQELNSALNRDLCDARAQNIELSEQMIEAEAENESLVMKLSSKSKECESMANESDRQKIVVSDLQKSMKQLKSELQSKDEKMQGNISAIDAQNREIEGLQDCLQKREEANRSMQKQIGVLRHKIDELENANSDLLGQKGCLTDALNKERQQLLATESTVKAQENKIQNLYQTIQDKEEEKRNVEALYNELGKSISSGHDEKEAAYLATIEKQRATISGHCQVIEELKEKLSNAQTENINLCDKNKSIRQGFNETVDRQKALQARVDEMEAELSMRLERESQDEDEIEKLRQEISNLEKENNVSIEQIAAVTTQNQQLREQIEELRITADQCLGANDELVERQAERDRLLATVNQSKNRINELDKVNQSLHFEIEALLAEKKALAGKLENNEEEAKSCVAKYKSDISRLKSDAEAQKEQVKSLRSKIKEMEKQHSVELEEKNIELIQRVFDLENKLNCIARNPEYVDSKVKLASYSDEIRRLQAKLLALQSEEDRKSDIFRGQKCKKDNLIIEALRIKVRELERVNENLDFANRTLRNSEEMRDAELADMQRRLDQEQNERDRLAKRIKEVTHKRLN